MSQGQKGYLTILSVLIVGTVGVTISLSLLLLGLGSSRAGFAVEQSNQAKAFANTCADDALERMRLLNSFTGTRTLTIGQGSCTYTVTDLGGSNRRITASGTVGTVIRKVDVSVDQLTPIINIVSWQEVADF